MLTLNDPRHGSLNGYTNHGCRCVECVAAMSAYYRERRGGSKPKQPGRYHVAPSTGNGIKSSAVIKLEIKLGLTTDDYAE